MASGLFVVSAAFVAVTAAIATGDLAWQALDDVAAQRALILYVLGLVHGVLLAVACAWLARHPALAGRCCVATKFGETLDADDGSTRVDHTPAACER